MVRVYAKVRRNKRSVLRRMGVRRFVLEAGESRRVRVPIRRHWRRKHARGRTLTVVARARYESLAGGRLGIERRYRLRAPRLRRSGG
jgi:hypothetical protein